jgi:large repetitive protein
MSVRTRVSAGLTASALAALSIPALAGLAVAAPTAPLAAGLAPVAAAAAVQTSQPVPGHTSLVPATPRKNTPLISNGEIWDIEVIPQLDRVFIAGSFSSLHNTTGSTTVVNQSYLASYNLTTGLIDTSFRPTFGGGGVSAVEASPDGTKLFVAGSFNSVGGVPRQKVASLDLGTGAAVPGFAFSKTTNGQVTALAASNTTVYIGGKFTRVNGTLLTGLAAANTGTGAIDTGFDNQISGGIGVNGALTVQQLKLTHDNSLLLVVHTGRKIDGQDRLGMALINTASKQLLPWRSHLWDDNLSRVGGVTRVYAADISPDDSYFVVTSGSGGDAPPISDVAVAYPLNAAALGNSDVQPMWITRCFDSVYSVAITEKAVYIGGHFSWNESPTANQPWPGLDNVGYGTGQGLSGYGLGDQVVRRDHIGALDPATGTALEWSPGSNSFEGNKAMEATPRGLIAGGDAMIQGGYKTGRIAFYDFNTVPAASSTDTTITAPIEGRVVPSGSSFLVTGSAKSPAGIKRVQVEITDRDTGRYLQDDGVTWGASNNIYASLASGSASATPRLWSLPLSITGNHNLQISAKTYGVGGPIDSTPALKKVETFSFDDQTPTTSISGPSSGVLASTTFTMTGTASDDHGVDSLSYWFRDANNQYLQGDGTVSSIFNTFRGSPDVVGATAATWSYDVTVPHEGVWRGSATASDTTGQADLRSATRDWTIDSNAVAPSVAINSPVTMTPPFAAPTVVVTPGQPISFSGTATDDTSLQNVEISLRNTTTRENLGADGTWGVGVTAGQHRISPVNINASSYNWSYTTPFNLSAGSYSYSVRATDNDGLTTASANQGRLTISAQVNGDSPPNGLLNGSTTTPVAITSPHIDLAGTATDDLGVQSLQVTVLDNDTGRYLQNNATMLSGYNALTATLASPGATSSTWTLPIDLPTRGDFSVTALAYDTAGQQDSSTTGATNRYRYYPGDAAPSFDAALGQPVDGSTFNQGQIVVTGRALDDVSMTSVGVGIVNSAGLYMSSTGAFTSTTPSFRTAFLNSPGSPGSNFSYTTPVIAAGTYTVIAQATDNHYQVSAQRINTGIVVTQPANNPPVASATVSCNQNVCTFDGRGTTDEDTSSLTYAWAFGTGQGTATGPLPTRTFTAPGTFAVTLTVKDEWNATATATLNVTIAEPSGNVAPTPTVATNCIALACSTSSTGTTDPNTGDVITYSWNWGDQSTPSAGAAAAHTYATQGTYTVTLTATDGWGKAASTTRTLVLTEPANNSAPTVAFTSSCTGLVCQLNSNGTSDSDGDQIRYSWNFGDGTPANTTASPSHPYATAGDYSVVLTVTDGWNKSTVLTKSVTAG